MVIDDLASQPHRCDLLLDSTLGRSAADYAGKVTPDTTVLAGAGYAPLRSEFARLREQSLARRNTPCLRHLLVSMGGTDASNATGRVLASVAGAGLPDDLRITVVLGPHAPWLDQVRAQARNMPCPCEVRVDVADMARLMAESDLAVGAGGTTSWERCALGLPSLVMVLAGNQEQGASALGNAGAAWVIREYTDLAEALGMLLRDPGCGRLARMATAAANVCDGGGTARVIIALAALNGTARPMTQADIDAVLQWRNQPAVRQSMYSQHEIGKQEHLAWFERATQDPAPAPADHRGCRPANRLCPILATGCGCGGLGLLPCPRRTPR